MIRTEITEPWLEALESGFYGQGNGSLKTSEGTYCCLGVAAELLAGGGGSWSYVRTNMPNGKMIWKLTNPYSSNCEFLDDPSLIGASGAEQRMLAGWNDEGVPFTEIARRIRVNLAGHDSGWDVDW